MFGKALAKGRLKPDWQQGETHGNHRERKGLCAVRGSGTLVLESLGSHSGSAALGCVAQG